MKRKTLFPIIVAAAAVAAFTPKIQAHDGDHHDKKENASQSADAKNAKPYPLDTCVVSDEKFEHGKPYVFVHEGQQIKLCCKDCLKDFKKDPAKYMKKIQDAQSQQKTDNKS
jgi:hypothetical protein